MSEGVDVSYANGNYKPGAESWVIVNASRANIGLAVGSYYARQVDAARAAGKKVGHYFFNGNMDPVSCANYFVANLHDYRHGDLLAIDCEYESGTGTQAWTPAKALAFLTQVVALTGASWGTTAAYINRSIRGQWDWSPLWNKGVKKWIAAPDGDPGDWDIWQYSSAGGIDRNHVNDASLAGGGSTPINNNPILGGTPLPVFLLHPNGSLGYVSDAGELDAISDINEVNALVATGIVSKDPIKLANPQIWDLLTVRTRRLRAAAAPSVTVPAPVVNVDETAIVKAIVAALPTGANAAQITADVIAAIRTLAWKPQ